MFVVTAGVASGAGAVVPPGAAGPAAAEPIRVPRTVGALVRDYCADCHDAETQKAKLDLESILSSDLAAHADRWERALRKLRARQMPPADKRRPDERTYERVVAALESALDAAAARHPNPGRTETLRRLNRAEYQNAIRDLLALEVDAAAWLPKDDAGHGFDNVNLANLSPTLLDRYLTAAQKISRLAVGAPQRVGGDTFRLPPDLTQEHHVEGLPLGTRGGALLRHTFPQDAEYEFQIRLTRDRNDEVEGLREAHELHLLIDRERVAAFVVEPPKDRNFDAVDRHLKARVPVKAGPHDVGVTFVKNPWSLLETKRQPYNVHFNMHRHPRVGPAAEHGRGGLLRHGSVLAVTSYATRTSPVLRGKWVLENLLGTPPPPPLPDVPALDSVVAANLSVRERLAQHRANAACAGCHNVIDPPGFALEHFDAVGRWRHLEEGKPVDASGGLLDGSAFTGVSGLEDGLLRRPELFAGTLTEKLLTFALGRGLEHYDAPAVRKIVREARAADYRISSLIVGVTQSVPFTMRRSP